MSAKSFIRKTIILFVTILSSLSLYNISAYAAAYLKPVYKIENHKKIDLGKELRRTEQGKKLNNIAWSSSDTSAVSINSSGIATAKRIGRYTIKAVSGKTEIETDIIVAPNSTLNYNAVRIPVLMFHRVVEDDVYERLSGKTEWTAKRSEFQKQLQYLYEKGYRTISLEEFYQWHQGKRRLPENSVLLTFDDGHSEGYHIIYPLLRKYRFKAVFFIIGAMTPERTGTGGRIGRDKIAEIRRNYPALEIQSHTWNLHRKINGLSTMRSFTKEEIIADFRKMELEFGFRYLAYPFSSYTENTIYAFKRSNLKMAFRSGASAYATKNDPVYAIRRIAITANTTLKELRKWVGGY